jgi:hypothetical protein
MMPDGSRADTYDVEVSVNNINFHTFDKMEGGEIDSAETKYAPGNMGEEESLGGKRTVTNVIVRRLYKLHRDHIESQRYINWAGKAPMVVTKIPLDIDGVPFGTPIVYRGTLKRVKFPDHDSESNDAGLLELEMTVDGLPSGMPRP